MKANAVKIPCLLAVCLKLIFKGKRQLEQSDKECPWADIPHRSFGNDFSSGPRTLCRAPGTRKNQEAEKCQEEKERKNHK